MKLVNITGNPPIVTWNLNCCNKSVSTRNNVGIHGDYIVSVLVHHNVKIDKLYIIACRKSIEKLYTPEPMPTFNCYACQSEANVGCKGGGGKICPECTNLVNSRIVNKKTNAMVIDNNLIIPAGRSTIFTYRYRIEHFL